MNNNKLGAQDYDRLVSRNGKAVRDWRIAAIAKQELNAPLAAGQGERAAREAQLVRQDCNKQETQQTQEETRQDRWRKLMHCNN